MHENRDDMQKKTAASPAIVTTAVFIWLSIGFINEAEIAGRNDIWPVLLLYTAFPLLVWIVSVRRVKELQLISEQETNLPADSEEQAEDTEEALEKMV